MPRRVGRCEIVQVSKLTMLNSPIHHNSRFLAGSKTFSRAASLLVILVGLLVLIGWLFDIYELKSGYGNITMKANSALSLFLAGLSLWALNLDEKNALTLRAAQVCAALVTLVGILTLSEHVFGWNLGIDQLLFTEQTGALATASPGRMGPPASFCFTFSGITLLLLHARRAFSLAQLLSIVVSLWSLLAIIGYTYQAEELYGIARYTGIALHTAVSFFVLSLGLFAARMDQGIASVISSDQAGGLMARRLLITAIGVPFLLGWLRLLAQRAGYFDLGFGTAFLVLAIIIILTSVIWHSAAKLNLTEQQRVAAETAVHESEERLKSFLNNSAVIGWIKDDQGRHTFLSRNYKQRFGIGTQDGDGKTDIELWPREIADQFWHNDLAVLTSGEPIEVIEEITNPDGTLSYWLNWKFPFQDTVGKRYVGGLGVDITERKRVEDALRQSEERFAKAFEVSPLALTITSLKTGKLLEVNETFTRLSGYRREEAVGRSTEELGLWARASDREAELAMLSQRGQLRNIEYRFRMKDGTERIGLLSAEQIEIGGEPCALTVILDITKQKWAEAEREQLLVSEQEARRQAEATNRLKDEFLATVSHELRTPLNAILGWTTMLQRGKLDEATATRGLKTIERNAQVQAQLIEDLLDVSRIISGKLRLDVKPIELTQVIKAAIDSVKSTADAKAIELQIEINPAADSISGDSTRLQQVLWNLLSNAVKFTPKGGLVQVRLDRTDLQAHITVSDTGEGINPEFLPYVFDRFQQADGTTTRRHGGLGLGLAIARHLVEMHGGTIEAHSAGAEQGTTFTVKLPLVVVRQTEPLPTVHSEIPSQEETPITANPAILYGLRILIVDDEADSRDMLKVVLEQYGADVLTAASAREAYEALQGWKPDVLVCDIGMPEEDGNSLIRKVRALDAEQGGNTPAIALTGYVRVEDRRRALEAGYQLFLPKPVEVNELASRITNLIYQTDKSMEP